MVSIEFTDVVKSFAAAEEALGVDEGGNVDGLAVATAADLDAHEGDTANPHAVTKSQVGLGNVDNTADADKPISTATQAALDTKVSTSDLPGGDPANILTTADIGGSDSRGVQATIPDTGWVDLSSSLTNGWTLIANGYVRVRRWGPFVSFEADGLDGTAATGNTLLSLASQFLPSTPAVTPAATGVHFTAWDGLTVAASTTAGFVGAGGGVQIRRTGTTGDTSFNVTYLGSA